MNVQFQSNSISNFKGLRIATVTPFAKNKSFEPIEIYRVTREDRVFLNDLNDRIDYKNLFPNLKESLQKRWQKIFKYCIAYAHDNDNVSYVAIQNNRPCGIITYLAGDSFFLDGICSIPQEKNKKVPFAGLTLLYQLFRDAQEHGASEIKLRAVTDGPYDVVKKYEKCGFKKDPTSVPYTEMRCNKHKIKEQLKEFPFTLEYTELERERVPLSQFLD